MEQKINESLMEVVGITHKSKPKRTLCVGDIHGGLKNLIQVLERCNYNSKEDRIIFLGDYVDGWSETAELIQYLIELNEASTYKHVFLMGNHDDWCGKWLSQGQCPLIWTQQGGQATIDSYIRTGYITSLEHKDFFRKLELFYVDEENRGFVHGGFISRKGLGFEAYPSDYYWDRDLWQLALLLHSRESEGDLNEKATRFRKHKEVYIGHTSTTSWNCKPHYPESKNPKQENKNGPILIPMNRCNVWNMDTGAGYFGKLSIMDIDTKEFWQSDFAHFNYSNEKGRG
jgi:serine/threonine protein phosphatase 1